jgi:hypothetical protein
MASLGAIICQTIVYHYGRDEFLRRLAHPFWFQSFGAVMGMDWHSSGITTSVIGALKRGLAPPQGELGIHVCGGRGRHSRRTPEELKALGDRCTSELVVTAPGGVWTSSFRGTSMRLAAQHHHASHPARDERVRMTRDPWNRCGDRQTSRVGAEHVGVLVQPHFELLGHPLSPWLFRH